MSKTKEEKRKPLNAGKFDLNAGNNIKKSENKPLSKYFKFNGSENTDFPLG